MGRLFRCIAFALVLANDAVKSMLRGIGQDDVVLFPNDGTLLE